MDFLDKIEQETGNLVELAKKYICTIYPDISEADLKDPEPGEQKFVFIAGNDVFYVARNREISALMRQEHDTLETLASLKTLVSTPEVRDYQAENHIMRVSRLNGKPLSESLDSLPTETLRSIGQRLGSFIAQMHHHLPQELEAHTALYEVALAKVSKAFDTASSERETQRIHDVQTHAMRSIESNNKTVTLHSDLHPGNILYDPETDELSVIDFTGLKPGARYREFIKPYAHMPTDMFNELKNSYKELSGHKIDDQLIQVGSDTFDVATFSSDSGPFRTVAN